jgi:hypothetical protein
MISYGHMHVEKSKKKIVKKAPGDMANCTVIYFDE